MADTRGKRAAKLALLTTGITLVAIGAVLAVIAGLIWSVENGHPVIAVGIGVGVAFGLSFGLAYTQEG